MYHHTTPLCILGAPLFDELMGRNVVSLSAPIFQEPLLRQCESSSGKKGA